MYTCTHTNAYTHAYTSSDILVHTEVNLCQMQACVGSWFCGIPSWQQSHTMLFLVGLVLTDPLGTNTRGLELTPSLTESAFSGEWSQPKEQRGRREERMLQVWLAELALGSLGWKHHKAPFTAGKWGCKTVIWELMLSMYCSLSGLGNIREWRDKNSRQGEIWQTMKAL